MKECNGDHDHSSGFTIVPKEVLRVSLKLSERNGSRVDYVSASLIRYATRLALRAGRIPMLDTLCVYIVTDDSGQYRAHVRVEVEPHSGEWACAVRALESTRIERLLDMQQPAPPQPAPPQHRGLMN